MINKKRELNFKYAIGIDCGVNTGLAVWCVTSRSFLNVQSLKIHRALLLVAQAFANEPATKVFIEDARLRKWFGSNSNAKLQGAGSIKRDSTIWEDFCLDHGIPFVLVAPKHNLTKLSSLQFKSFTSWQPATNEHARDAAMLVFQRNA